MTKPTIKVDDEMQHLMECLLEKAGGNREKAAEMLANELRHDPDMIDRFAMARMEFAAKLRPDLADSPDALVEEYARLLREKYPRLFKKH